MLNILEGHQMWKITNIGEWKVYKADAPGSAWKWVAMHKDKVIDTFPTKKKAMQFVAKYIQEGAN